MNRPSNASGIGRFFSKSRIFVKIHCMVLFISGAEIVFVFFIVLLVFGADKIPSIARSLAKGMTQVRQATNDIKSEIKNSVDMDDPTKNITKDLKKEVDDIKNDFNDLTDSIKRDL